MFKIDIDFRINSLARFSKEERKLAKTVGIGPRTNSSTLSESVIASAAGIARAAVYKIAVDTKNYMREFINTHRRRNPETHGENPSEKRKTNVDSLSSVIDVHELGSVPGFYAVGVGSVQELGVFAPYWYLINYGGLARVKSPFIPGSFNGNPADPALKGTGIDAFNYEKGSKFGMSSDNLTIILPMHYVDRTEDWLRQNANILARKYGEQK